MMDRADRAALVFFGILAILVVALIVAATCLSVIRRQARNALGVCLDANYPKVEYARGQWYCIGIENGSSVAVPVGEVGR